MTAKVEGSGTGAIPCAWKVIALFMAEAAELGRVRAIVRSARCDCALPAKKLRVPGVHVPLIVTARKNCPATSNSEEPDVTTPENKPKPALEMLMI